MFDGPLMLLVNWPVVDKVTSLQPVSRSRLQVNKNLMTVLLLERFSIECRKTKTKVIALANHKGHKQDSEPIKTRSNCMWLTQSAGKRVRASQDWFWFYF